MSLAQLTSTPPATAFGRGPGLSRAPWRRRAGAASIALLHAAAGWMLWQAAPNRLRALETPVLSVAVLQVPPDVPAPDAAPSPRAPEVRMPVLAVPVPEVPTRADPPPAAERPPAPSAPPVPPSLPEAQAQPRPVAAAFTPPPPTPAPQQPAAPRTLPGSAIAYLVPPPVELPLASRRLGEQGTVWLLVQVGADGLPRQVSVQRSSGYARLDEQAVQAMRRARFRPQVENGTAIAWTVVAPVQYELT